jgi:hypothetical protein
MVCYQKFEPFVCMRSLLVVSSILRHTGLHYFVSADLHLMP